MTVINSLTKYKSSIIASLLLTNTNAITVATINKLPKSLTKLTTLTVAPTVLTSFSSSSFSASLSLHHIFEGQQFLHNMYTVYDLYIKHGSKSSKNVDYFHNYIKTELKQIFTDEMYQVKLEYNVDAVNSTGKKKCDIVVFKRNAPNTTNTTKKNTANCNKIENKHKTKVLHQSIKATNTIKESQVLDYYPYIIFPVKIIKSNYKQNKNNGWENLTGELSHIMWANPNVNIIPINIFMSDTPYLNSAGKITKFERITYTDIATYNILKERNIAYDMMNYIFDVEHFCKVGSKYTKTPNLLRFNSETPFRSLRDIVGELCI